MTKSLEDGLNKNRRASLLHGARDMVPILPGMAPFGLLAGATALTAGLDAWQAQALSLVWLAGAAQLAAIDLVAQETAWPVILLTVLVINLRFLMYSAVLAPMFARSRLAARLGLASLVTDQGFALVVAREREGMTTDSLRWYYLGSGAAIWVTWQLSTLLGSQVGALIPAAWQLDFSVPLVFLALLVPLLTDRPSLVTAAVAAAVAVAGRGLPSNLGLMLGVAVGIAAGLVVEQLRETRDEGTTS